MFCPGCGNELSDGVAFCPKCGTPTGSTAPAPLGTARAAETPQVAAGSGLEENVAAMLCYVLGWLTGLIVVLIDKRPYVRFHAMQSIITFGGLHLLQMILISGGIFGGMSGVYMFWGMASLFYSVFYILIVVSWVVCMVKAYQGQRFKLPVVGNIAERYAK